MIVSSQDMCDSQASDCLRRCILMLKDRIGRNQAEWDRWKHACNPYELVYNAPPHVCTPNGSRKPPTSRAFYKLWEIAHDVAHIRAVMLDPAPKRFVYLAEAPGSFVEAVVSMRRGAEACDAHIGVSLAPVGRSVPNWKLPASWMAAYNVSIFRGRRGDGDITREDTIDDLVRFSGGEGTCDIVTGDGGFDFSENFNEQEAQVIRLLASELLAASRLLKPGGGCVIKVFDAFNDDTVSLLSSFMDTFAVSEIRKPATSRPANSERYIVCSGYIPSPGFTAACKVFITGDSDGFPIRGSASSLAYIRSANVEHAAKQLENIIFTMQAMESAGAPAIDMSGQWIDRFMPGVTGRSGERTPA